MVVVIIIEFMGQVQKPRLDESILDLCRMRYQQLVNPHPETTKPMTARFSLYVILFQEVRARSPCNRQALSGDALSSYRNPLIGKTSCQERAIRDPFVLHIEAMSHNKETKDYWDSMAKTEARPAVLLVSDTISICTGGGDLL